MENFVSTPVVSNSVLFTHLDESGIVELVLGGNLESNTVGLAGLRVPGSLSTSLNLRVDLVVVASSEDAQVVGSNDRGSVLGDGVSDSSRVLADLSVDNVVANLSTGKETVMANNNITVERRALEKVEETTGAEEGLLEVQVDLGALALGGREERCEDFSLEAVGEGVVKLDLGVESVGSGPGLGKGQTCEGVS